MGATAQEVKKKPARRFPSSALLTFSGVSFLGSVVVVVVRIFFLETIIVFRHVSRPTEHNPTLFPPLRLGRARGPAMGGGVGRKWGDGFSGGGRRRKNCRFARD